MQMQIICNLIQKNYQAEFETGLDDFEALKINPLIATLKPQSNGPPYNTVIGTLAVDGWAVTFGIARRDWMGPQPPRPLLTVPNVTAHPSTASVPTSYYSMWHYCLWSLKG